ncbi:MAG TPA: hypothetical protein VHO24_09425 [Opitutaceae bacterium]|nr:hypothetical protein [Opitutaceae bacterium]
MNLSTHSISSHSSRYPAKSAKGAVDSPAAAEPTAEFDALFADMAQRGDVEGARSKVTRSETRANSRGAESPSSRAHARTEEEEKASKHTPNENLVSPLAILPPAPPADDAGLETVEVLTDPAVASLTEEPDELLENEAEAGGEDIASAPFESGEVEDFAATPPPLPKESVPAPDAVAKEIPKADAQKLTAMSLAREVSSEEKAAEKTKKVAIAEAPKRGSAKSPGDTRQKAAADFAELENDVPLAEGASEMPAPKNFLSDKVKGVTERDESLGINVAKVAAHMNQVASPHELAGLLSKQGAVHDVAGFSGFATQNPPAAQAPALSGLHQAVNAAMEAGERMKSDGQRAVDLQFSFGSDDLSVRVELHEGRVRATFRTDSAEIRGALAQEWQVLNAAGADRAKRFADPVFAANSSTPSAGDHQEKRGGRDQDLHASAERFEISNSRGVSAPASARPVASVPSPQTAVPLTALRLHTFA